MTIGSSAERVWAIISEFKSYPDWTTFLNIDGDIRDRNVVVVYEGTKMNGVVLAAKTNEEFRFKCARSLGLVMIEHFIAIDKIDKTKCKMRHGQIQSGLGILCCASNSSALLKGFHDFNEAVKDRSETGNLGNISSVKLPTAVNKLKKVKK